MPQRSQYQHLWPTNSTFKLSIWNKSLQKGLHLPVESLSILSFALMLFSWHTSHAGQSCVVTFWQRELPVGPRIEFVGFLETFFFCIKYFTLGLNFGSHSCAKSFKSLAGLIGAQNFFLNPLQCALDLDMRGRTSIARKTPNFWCHT